MGHLDLLARARTGRAGGRAGRAGGRGGRVAAGRGGAGRVGPGGAGRVGPGGLQQQGASAAAARGRCSAGQRRGGCRCRWRAEEAQAGRGEDPLPGQEGVRLVLNCPCARCVAGGGRGEASCAQHTAACHLPRPPYPGAFASVQPTKREVAILVQSTNPSVSLRRHASPARKCPTKSLSGSPPPPPAASVPSTPPPTHRAAPPGAAAQPHKGGAYLGRAAAGAGRPH